MIQPIYYKYYLNGMVGMEIVVIDLYNKSHLCQIVSYKNYPTPFFFTCYSDIFSPCHTDVD